MLQFAQAILARDRRAAGLLLARIMRYSRMTFGGVHKHLLDSGLTTAREADPSLPHHASADAQTPARAL